MNSGVATRPKFSTQIKVKGKQTYSTETKAFVQIVIPSWFILGDIGLAVSMSFCEESRLWAILIAGSLWLACVSLLQTGHFINNTAGSTPVLP